MLLMRLHKAQILASALCTCQRSLMTAGSAQDYQDQSGMTNACSSASASSCASTDPGTCSSSGVPALFPLLWGAPVHLFAQQLHLVVLDIDTKHRHMQH